LEAVLNHAFLPSIDVKKKSLNVVLTKHSLAMSLTSSVFGMMLKKSSGVAEHIWKKMDAFISDGDFGWFA
jgi:hypothetical protein